MCAVVAMECGDRVRCAALRDHIARAAFASAALRAHTEFELHFVEGHPCTNMACNLAVGHSAANANDHGSEGASAGWLKMADYKYEFVAFAIAIGMTLRRPRLPRFKTKKKRGQAPLCLLRLSRSPDRSLLDLAHLRLQVVLQADLADQVDLRFEKVDVLFGVVQDLLQQVA